MSRTTQSKQNRDTVNFWKFLLPQKCGRGLGCVSRQQDSPGSPFWETCGGQAGMSWSWKTGNSYLLLHKGKVIEGGEGCCNTDLQNRNCLQGPTCFALYLGKTCAFTDMYLPSRILKNSKNKSPFLTPSIRTESRKRVTAFWITCANLDDSCVAFPD